LVGRVLLFLYLLGLQCGGGRRSQKTRCVVEKTGNGTGASPHGGRTLRWEDGRYHPIVPMLVSPFVVVLISINTPFGVRDVGCTLEVPHGTFVDEDEHGLLLSHPLHGTWRHKAPMGCGQNNKVPPASSNITCASLPCNNWIDNAGWQQSESSTPIGGFSAKYLVPATPTKSGQTLFYFIGAENTDGRPRHGQPPPSGRAILQPVLTYDPDGWCKASSTGWCFASWYCCPKNITVHSAYVQDVTPFDSFLSFFNISEDRETYTVTGTSTATGKAATLHCPRQGRNMNWADVTLEVYAITSCEMFSASRMAFSSVTVWDQNFKELQPVWSLSPASPCGGSVTVDPEAHPTIHIEHIPTSLQTGDGA
jgi:hypothetical protein